ncbi:MAG TPA: glyoxalase [Clostridiales bacterium]|nr:glyoxalase [Clostridiales bacterium]
MKFCWSTLHVKNMTESLTFYQEIVGLKLDRHFRTETGMEIAFLGEGETKVELIGKEEEEPIEIGKDISWGFEIESVNNMMDFLKDKGIAIHEGPFQPNPNIRFFYIMDPNGLKIQFVETIKY